MSLRQELLSALKRKWDEVLTDVECLYFIPNRKKHESGYECINIVAVDYSGEKHLCGRRCDHINLNDNSGFASWLGALNLDCIYPSGIIRAYLFSDDMAFRVGTDLSSIYISIERRIKNE